MFHDQGERTVRSSNESNFLLHCPGGSQGRLGGRARGPSSRYRRSFLGRACECYTSSLYYITLLPLLNRFPTKKNPQVHSGSYALFYIGITNEGIYRLNSCGTLFILFGFVFALRTGEGEGAESRGSVLKSLTTHPPGLEKCNVKPWKAFQAVLLPPPPRHSLLKCVTVC